MVKPSPAMNVFLGCDWGSPSFRWRRVETPSRRVETPSRRVVAEQTAAAGVKSFAKFLAVDRAEHMARFLAERISAWPELAADLPILVTGMAGSNVGWRELPYAPAPFPLDASRAEVGRVDFPDVDGRMRRALLGSPGQFDGSPTGSLMGPRRGHVLTVDTGILDGRS